MKKILLISIIFSLFLFFFTGCSSSDQGLTNDDYILSNENITSKGITIGSSSGDFIKAYDGCIVNVLYADENNNVAKTINIKNIDYAKQSHVALPMLFIDDKPINVKDFNEIYKVNNDINSWLDNNNSFLQEHTLIYKCLIFTFEDGNITNIQLSEKNYNE